MDNLIGSFLGHLTAEECAENTSIQYGSVLQRLEAWLIVTHQLSLAPEHVGQITGLILAEYYQNMHNRGLAVSTRNNYVVAIKQFFAFLMAANVISVNPTDVLHCVKEKKQNISDEDQLYTSDELQALLALMSSGDGCRNDLRDAAMVALMLGSGLRASEVCSLNISDLDGIRKGLIRCKRKGGDWEPVHVAQFVSHHVERYLLTRRGCKPDEPLFLSQKGQRMNRNSLWKSLAAKQKKVNLHTGVHRFRHTFLSDTQRDGAAMARDLGGHSSVSITNNYLHTTAAERTQAVNSVRYADLLSE